MKEMIYPRLFADEKSEYTALGISNEVHWMSKDSINNYGFHLYGNIYIKKSIKSEDIPDYVTKYVYLHEVGHKETDRGKKLIYYCSKILLFVLLVNILLMDSIIFYLFIIKIKFFLFVIFLVLIIVSSILYYMMLKLDRCMEMEAEIFVREKWVKK